MPDEMIFSKSNRYDFIVTGASGNVGRYLIPTLANHGFRVLALGRDASALRTMYADHSQVDCADYEDHATQETCSTLIHLAVRNNNQPGSLEDFTRDNVDFASRVCAKFNSMGGKRFINISSIQSLDHSYNSHYALSKDMAKRRIEDFVGSKLDNVHMGYFYSYRYYGERLSFLSGLGSIGDVLFGFFKSLKPTTSSQSLADYVIGPANSLPPPQILTDDLLRSLTYRSVTRALDLIVAVLILVLLLPILVILWLVIRADSPGPAVFAQTRVGKKQAPFTLYKFRTMKRDTVAAGTHEVSVSAVTKIGRFLRKTKLDELPQAVNLLRGEMTLVGPRPCLPVQEELVNARAALGVYAMKPGITGYAQIREIDMSRPQELANSDYTYMKLQSLTLNLKIILLTALGRGGGDRVAPPGKL
jgi:lipopolysaccharide/colanic/teichoic acid biosynthesis glycosyltransferase